MPLRGQRSLTRRSICHAASGRSQSRDGKKIRPIRGGGGDREGTTGELIEGKLTLKIRVCVFVASCDSEEEELKVQDFTLRFYSNEIIREQKCMNQNIQIFVSECRRSADLQKAAG